MTEYQSLTTSEVKETASTYFANRQSRCFPQQQPSAVLVAGQPGAGKSAAASKVKTGLVQQGGYIHVDADRMRERIRVGNSKPSSTQTQADAGRLANALRSLAMQGQCNILEEGTFRNLETAHQTVQELQQLGYQVELWVVATSREESLLGIYQRHELQHAAGGTNPRFVSEQYHDEAMQGLDRSLTALVEMADRVRVVNRSVALLYESTMRGNQLPAVMAAVSTGRALNDSKLAEIIKAWNAVATAARQRNAPDTYLEAIHRHAERLKEMRL